MTPGHGRHSLPAGAMLADAIRRGPRPDEPRLAVPGATSSLVELPGLGRVRAAVVSTAPPRQCGIATFSANLCDAIRRNDTGIDLEFAAIVRPDGVEQYGQDVRWRISQGDPVSFLRAAHELSRSGVDVVCVEHEFGLCGVWDGEYQDHLGPFLAALQQPAITTFHTVLPQPAPSVLAAVRGIARESAFIVVMTEVARRLLHDVYGVAGERVRVIPHGVPAMHTGQAHDVRSRLDLADRTVISTFGLVDPRKGLEFMVDAMYIIARRHPDAIYLILGRTHPELVASQGERYRESIEESIEGRSLGGHVRLVDEYLTEDEIVDYLAATDIYVTPYLDPDQITSGTLAYALGAGKAIVSTPYLHAAEALDGGAGLLVDFRSADALAEAVLRIIEEPGLREELERNAYREGAKTSWPRVASTVSTLVRRTAAEAAQHNARPGHGSMLGAVAALATP